MTANNNQRIIRAPADSLPKWIKPWESLNKIFDFEGSLYGADCRHFFAEGEAPESINCKLRLSRNEDDRPLLCGELDCILHVSCNRCLETMEEHVHSEFRYILVRSEAEEQQVDDGSDTWLCSEDVFYLADFVCEEINLSRENYPKHPHCQNPYLNAQPQHSERQRPFQNLDKLLNLKEK